MYLLFLKAKNAQQTIIHIIERVEFLNKHRVEYAIREEKKENLLVPSLATK